MRKLECRREALFQYRGLPPVGMAVSMALQHLVAMIVGCVTPAIIIANVAGLTQDQRVLLIQASLVMSAVTTLLQLFPSVGASARGCRWSPVSASLICPVCRPSAPAAAGWPLCRAL